MVNSLTEDEKKRINSICYKLVTKGYKVKYSKYSNRRIRRLAKRFDFYKDLPILKFKDEKRRTMQGGGIIAKTYLHFLIEESLKYDISNIVVPYIGVLQIREVDPKGSKWIYFKDKKKQIRLDTVFDEKVMYRIFFKPYFRHKMGSLVNFNFSKKIFRHILSTLYKRELEPGVYPFYKKVKK